MSDAAASRALVATASQTVGPFFHLGLTPDGVVNGVQPAANVPRIELVVRVTDGDGRPVDDAMVEIWYAADTSQRQMFARLPTDEDGRCTFEIARPDGRITAAGGPAAPHLNVCLFARGLLRQLHTRIYFAGEGFSVEGGWTEPALRGALDAVVHLIDNSGGTFVAGFDFNADYPRYSEWSPARGSSDKLRRTLMALKG